MAFLFFLVNKGTFYYFFNGNTSKKNYFWPASAFFKHTATKEKTTIMV